MNYIDEGLCPEILKRLPPKSLCRFRCVCKSWNSVILSPFFINLHNNFSTLSIPPPNLKTYLKVDFPPYKFQQKSYALYRPQSTLVEHLRHDLQSPFRTKGDINSTFIDVIHGLVCLFNSSSRVPAILWNPSIQKYLSLPPLSHVIDHIDPVDIRCCSIGFGYDSSKNDFKVVRLRLRDSFDLKYEVYSTREGVWRMGTTDSRSIEPCEFDSCIRTSCFVNGTIHWMASKQGKYSVLMFNCELEEFTTTELPRQVVYYDSYWDLAKLMEYHGMLSVLVYLPREEKAPIELWVMEEHGVVDSWKKLFRIQSGVRLSLNDTALYIPLLSPNQLTHFVWNGGRFYYILSFHVYQESLFLMDDTEAKSYTKEKKVTIF